MCGHLGLAQEKAQAAGIAEAEATASQSLFRSMLLDGRPGGLGRLATWSAELMADAYAGIRLALLLDRIYRPAAESQTGSDDADAVLVLMLTPLFAITALLGFARGQLGETDRNFTKSPFDVARLEYPTEMCRLVNLIGTYFFCIYPLGNLNVGLPNIFTRAIFRHASHRMNEAVLCAEISAGISFVFTNWWRLGIASAEDVRRLRADLDRLWACVALMRVGMNLVLGSSKNAGAGRALVEGLDEDDKRKYFAYVLQGNAPTVWVCHMATWNYAMEYLTTYFNMVFGQYIPEDMWVKGIRPPLEKTAGGTYELDWGDASSDPLNHGDRRDVDPEDVEFAIEYYSVVAYTRDPAYHVLDNWMSHMQYYFTGRRYVEPRPEIDMNSFSFRNDLVGCISFGMNTKRIFFSDVFGLV